MEAIHRCGPYKFISNGSRTGCTTIRFVCSQKKVVEARDRKTCELQNNWLTAVAMFLCAFGRIDTATD